MHVGSPLVPCAAWHFSPSLLRIFCAREAYQCLHNGPGVVACAKEKLQEIEGTCKRQQDSSIMVRAMAVFCLQSLAESVYRCNPHGQFTYRSASLTAVAMLFKLIESLGPTAQHSCLVVQQIWQLSIWSFLARGSTPSDSLVGCVRQTLWFSGPSFSEMLVSGQKTYTELCGARRS